MLTLAQVVKRCDCPRARWSKCEHSWTVRYWIDGGTRQREKSFKRNYKAAQQFATQIEADKLSVHFGDAPPPISFKDYASQWLESQPASPGTMKIYESALRVHLLPTLGHRKLPDVAADREAVTKLLKSLSPGVQKPAYTALSALLSEAERSGRITVNRLRAIRLSPPPAQRKLRFATHDELTKLAEGLGDLAPMIWIMRGTGIRPGECLALRKSDFVNGHLRVSRQQTRHDRQAPLKARKPGEYRDVPCPGYVRQMVDDMPDGPLFGVMDARVFNQRFRRAADAAGLIGFRPHDLRHTFASVTLAAGAPITDVARWLGHANIQVTYATYSHFIPSSFDTAKDALDHEYKEWSAAS